MNQYEIYAGALNALHDLATMHEKQAQAARSQVNQMLTELDERGLRVTWYPDTQSYTVTEMPKG